MTSRTPMPAKLSAKSQKLWRREIQRGSASPERLVMVEIALRALDRAEVARRLVARDGLVIGTGKMQHRHPGMQVEFDSLAMFLKLWRELRLDDIEDD